MGGTPVTLSTSDVWHVSRSFPLYKRLCITSSQHISTPQIWHISTPQKSTSPPPKEHISTYSLTNKSSVQFELVGQISELKLWRKSQTRGTNMTLACVILLTQKASSCAWTIWSQNHIECRLDVTGSLQKSRGADFRGCYRLLIAVGKILSSFKFFLT